MAEKKEKAAAATTSKRRRTKDEQFRMPDLITVVQDVTSLSRRKSLPEWQPLIHDGKDW